MSLAQQAAFLILCLGSPCLLFILGIKRALRASENAKIITATVIDKYIGERSMALGQGGRGLGIFKYEYTIESGERREETIYANYGEWEQYEVSHPITLAKVRLFFSTTTYTKPSFDSRYIILKRALKGCYCFGVLIAIALLFACWSAK